MSLRQAVFRLILAATCVVAATGSLAAASPMAAESSCPGRWYRVQQGDSWSNLAGRTGISVAELKVANAAVAQHPQGWLIVGQTLCLPPEAKDPAVSTRPPRRQPKAHGLPCAAAIRGPSWPRATG